MVEVEVVVGLIVWSSVHVDSAACDTGCEAPFALAASLAFGL